MGRPSDHDGGDAHETPIEAGRPRGDARRLFLSAVVLPIVLAGIACAWILWQIRGMADAAAWIDSSDRVIALASDAQRRIVDQELALHHFLFTQDARVLEPYRGASPEEDSEELGRLLSDDPEQLADVRQLQDLYAASRQEAEEAIVDPAPSRSAGVLQERWTSVAEMRSKATEIAAHEKSTRLARTRRFEAQTRAATLGATTLLALLAATSSLTSRRRIN